MAFKRTITNGKLDTVTECVGGPKDGTLVSNHLEGVRFLKTRPLSHCIISSSDALPSSPVEYEYVVYERVSQEKMALRNFGHKA